MVLMNSALFLNKDFRLVQFTPPGSEKTGVELPA
jgi:hypothetical protein